jgi:hypothetical protein
MRGHADGAAKPLGILPVRAATEPGLAGSRMGLSVTEKADTIRFPTDAPSWDPLPFCSEAPTSSLGGLPARPWGWSP